MAITFEQLLGKISMHRKNNNLPHVNPPFETIGNEIEDWICHQLIPDDQVRMCSEGNRFRPAVGWTELLGWMKANTHWIAGGGDKESHEEAERRATICASCPYNVPVQGCAICHETIRTYREKIIQAKPTGKDGELRACGVCGCDLRSIVHLPLTALQSVHHDFPDWCWQKKT